MAYKEFKVGEETVGALCTGSTPLYFKKVTGNSFFSYLGKELGGEIVELGEVLLYLGARQAGGADMKKVNYEDFLLWVDRFAPGDLIEVASEVVQFVLETTKEKSSPKE